MTEIDVSDIDGVGPGRADSLVDGGYETAADVANGTAEAIAEDTDLSTGVAENLVESALSAVPDEDEDGEEEWSGPEDQGVGSDETDGDGEDDGDYVVPIEMDSATLYHVIHVVLEDATAKEQTDATSARDCAYSIADELMRVSLDATGDTVDDEISLSQREVRALYRAITQGAQEYSRRSGVGDLWGKLESFRDVVNDRRE